ncbi:MAG: hypothetical protein DDT42_00623 [candidate division WS2 bacterium]|uniref:GerMN domain-containing protein n=1 Tax=Psychracetigena formicireducens TaxID=2986056 RepID=A0A9E2BII5_PSYF1|nr:hypothetical protein [Candidatus Psychracetigena formicireducens]MBT9144775.1 hypothetical protein [Candidatus Psychracetigena formicireducens]
MGKKIWLVILLVVFGLSLFVGGYFLGIAMKLQEFESDLRDIIVAEERPGLQIGKVSIDNIDYYEIWIPAGFPDKAGYGANFILLRRLVPFSPDVLDVLKSAMVELLNGPNEDEKAQGAFPLIQRGILLSAEIDEKGTAILNFSEDFDPKGGSLAIFMTTKAVEEVARQFTDINKVKILIEGVEDALQP